MISTVSGRKFATSAADWKFWHDSVASKLQALHDSGHALVIISNQGGIAKGCVAGARSPVCAVDHGYRNSTAEEIVERVVAVMKGIGRPMLALLATTNDHLRKPETGMWDFIEQQFGAVQRA